MHMRVPEPHGPEMKSIKGAPGHDTISYRGTELLNPWFVDNGSNTGICNIMTLNPLSMLGTRLQLEARNWQYFRFRRAVLHFKSSLPTTQGGQAAMFYLADPNTPFLTKSGNTLLRRLESLPETVTFNVWHDESLVVDWNSKAPWLRTQAGDEIRTSSFGSLGWALTSNPGLGTPASPSSIGLIMLDYEVEFCEPILDTNETTVELVSQSVSFDAKAASTEVQLTVNVASWTSNFPNTRVFTVTFQSGGSTTLATIPQTVYQQNEPAQYIYLTAGATFYASTSASGKVRLYPTLDMAFNAGDPLVWANDGQVGTATAGLVRVMPAVVDYN